MRNNASRNSRFSANRKTEATGPENSATAVPIAYPILACIVLF
jgi:hypothetical protein